MTPPSRSFRAPGAASTLPNITVDASPNDNTVLLLDHGPHVAKPAPFRHDDVAAEMAFRLDLEAIEHPPADVVTTDHVDADSVAAVLALVDPDRARPHRRVLVDMARAGDLQTFRDRRGARAAMAIRHLADSERSPLDGAHYPGRLPDDEAIETVMAHALSIVPDLLDDDERHRDLWLAEDGHLAATEAAIARGAITTVEHPVDRLTMFAIDPDLVVRTPGGLRHDYLSGPFEHSCAWWPMPSGTHLHPMALGNAARGFRHLLVQGRHYRYLDRPHSWLQYRAADVPARIDLRPVAQDLNFLEGGQVWEATPPSEPAATLATTAESNLDLKTVTSLLLRQLRAAPPAWDPFAVPVGPVGPVSPVGPSGADTDD